MAKAELGKKATDEITGFSGTITAITKYLNGCVHVCLEAAELKEGKPLEAWFDEQRVVKDSEVETGGPGSIPPKRTH